MEPNSLDEIQSLDEPDKESVTGDRPSDTPPSASEDTSEDKPLFVMADDEAVWQAYLATKERWGEVYRRLADS